MTQGPWGCSGCCSIPMAQGTAWCWEVPEVHPSTVPGEQQGGPGHQQAWVSAAPRCWCGCCRATVPTHRGWGSPSLRQPLAPVRRLEDLVAVHYEEGPRQGQRVILGTGGFGRVDLVRAGRCTRPPPRQLLAPGPILPRLIVPIPVPIPVAHGRPCPGAVRGAALCAEADPQGLGGADAAAGARAHRAAGAGGQPQPLHRGVRAGAAGTGGGSGWGGTAAGIAEVLPTPLCRQVFRHLPGWAVCLPAAGVLPGRRAVDQAA